MGDEIISFKTAKLAKEKGYDLECANSYTIKGEVNSSINYTGELFFDKIDINNAKANGHIITLAPTQTALQKWLREEHNIYLTFTGNKYFSSFNVLEPTIESYFKDVENHYEKALEKILYKSLKYI